MDLRAICILYKVSNNQRLVILYLAASDISRSTPNDHIWYSLTTNCLVATGRTYLRFRARANNDVHIAFTSQNNVTSVTAYDIVIGGWGNTRSTLRTGVEGTECVHTNHNPLSQTFFDEFWVSWTGSYVRVGTGTSVGSSYFLSCYQPSMYSVNFIWIRTGWGSSGEWRFENGNSSTFQLFKTLQNIMQSLYDSIYL